MSSDRPIGVFDSGVGGLTVVRSLTKRLPQEELVYLGDTARLPYGSKSAATIVRYSRMSTQFLLDRGVKMILIACNTASAVALDPLRAELQIPILGAVEPGAEAAVRATVSGKIGVIGTLGTVRSGAYSRAIDAAARAIGRVVQVNALACPMLVPLAEEGWVSGEITQAIARRYLGELKESAPELDVLVLGCTHYPILKPVLEQVATELFGHHVALVDSADAMADAAERELDRQHLRRTTTGVAGLTCFVTDEARIAEVGSRFLGRTLETVHRADL